NDNTCALPSDGAHGELQLVTTITACRREDVTGQTLRMDTHQWGLGVSDITLHQDHIGTLLPVCLGLITQDAELPLYGREGRLGRPTNTHDNPEIEDEQPI